MIPSTATSPISLASCRRAASCSGRFGPPTTSQHDTGVKRFHTPVVGELSLTFEAMELVADPGLTMVVYTAEPGSKSEEALNLLASWAATQTRRRSADHEEQPRNRGGA